MVMQASTQRRTRRPDQQLYVPVRGPTAKHSQSDTVVKDDHQEFGLKASKEVRSRRPDVAVYVPRAKRNALCFSERSSSLSVLPNVPKAVKDMEKASNCDASKESSDASIARQLAKIEVTCAADINQFSESLIKESTSWTDQVEQHVLNEADEKKDGGLPERDLDLQVDPQAKVYSSGYSSSSNEVSYFEQDLSSDDEINLVHGVQDQNLRNKLQDRCIESKQCHSAPIQISQAAYFPRKETVVPKFKAEIALVVSKLNASTKVQPQVTASFPVSKLNPDAESFIPKQNVSKLVQSREAAYFPGQDNEDFKKEMAKRDEILDRQIAIFDKLVAKAKARSAADKSKQEVSPPKPREASYFPQHESADFLRMLAKREKIVQHQISIFDKMLAPSKKGEKSPVFQRLVIPKDSSKPTASEVPDQVQPLNIPCKDSDHVSRVPPRLIADDSLVANLYSSVPHPCSMPSPSVDNLSSPEPMNNYFFIPAPPPSVPCADIDDTFYGSEYLDSPVSSSGDFYIPAPQPYKSIEFSIPPPHPRSVPSASVCRNFCNSGSLNLNQFMASLNVEDDFYIEPPRPAISRPVAKI